MNNGSPTATATATSPHRSGTPATPRGARRATPVPTAPSGLPTRRRWGRVAIGAVLALFGAWLCMILVATAGGRKETLALADDVGRGEVLERGDLKVVRVAADAGVEIDPGRRARRRRGRGRDRRPAPGRPAGPRPAPRRGRAAGGGRRGRRRGPASAAAAPRGDVPPGTPMLVVIRRGHRRQRRAAHRGGRLAARPRRAAREHRRPRGVARRARPARARWWRRRPPTSASRSATREETG